MHILFKILKVNNWDSMCIILLLLINICLEWLPNILMSPIAFKINKKIHKSLTCLQKYFYVLYNIQNRPKKKTNEKSITKEHQVAIKAGL